MIVAFQKVGFSLTRRTAVLADQILYELITVIHLPFVICRKKSPLHVNILLMKTVSIMSDDKVNLNGYLQSQSVVSGKS